VGGTIVSEVGVEGTEVEGTGSIVAGVHGSIKVGRTDSHIKADDESIV
jgi:hypothetical protein